ncbi:hypothetical protein CALCODRAFT_484820 [Calocera cornea HHB12733]|uniref:DUF6818 domain-containing protein n=1 Tax=Calocera cornea HHB12733 TaxID=1353952 RepID=A0A165EQT3_9BASI|nr:hypothetical protein CALCODRAFT_484820 [Calocera cornea HHB12733]
MSSSSLRAPSPTPTPSYVPSTFPQPSPTYVATTAPFPAPGYASQWGLGSPYSRSPSTLAHSPQLDADGFPRTLDDLHSYALASEPAATPVQDAQPPLVTRKRKAKKAAPEGARPIGPDGWEEVMAGMATYWATEGIEPRTTDSLKRKFNEMARKPKPTGDGEMPDRIRRAKDINKQIQDDVEMGNLQDDDNPNEPEEEEIPWSASDREDAPRARPLAQPARLSHTPSTSATDDVLVKQRRHVTSASKSTRQSKTSTLLANVSRAFDPDTQAERIQQREAIRAERSLFQSEISSLQGQLRDKQFKLVTVSMEKDKLIESLRTQLLEDARSLLAVQGELNGSL